MDGWMDGWMDGRMDGWMDGWMDVTVVRKKQKRGDITKKANEKYLSIKLRAGPWLEYHYLIIHCVTILYNFELTL